LFAKVDPLASQCGFRSVYWALNACGKNEKLKHLIENYRSKKGFAIENTEINGLEVSEVKWLIEEAGVRCDAGIITRKTFDQLPFQKCVMIVLLKHYDYVTCLRAYTPTHWQDKKL
jgi:hypothetical protein